MERYRQLLEVYSMEEILELCGLEPEEVLALLDEQGVLNVEIQPL